MKKIRAYLIVALFFFAARANSQNDISLPAQQNNISEPVHTETMALGFGAGFDYGGFGVNISFNPQQHFGLFAGAGYALAGLGYNVGAKFRFLSKKPVAKFTPYLMGMYGYNTAVTVKDATEYNKLFYGPTIGAGFDYRSGAESKGYWSFALLIPVRGADPKDYIKDLEDNHGVEFGIGLIPVAISAGYRIILF